MTGSWSNVVRIERAEDKNKREGKEVAGVSVCVSVPGFVIADR